MKRLPLTPEERHIFEVVSKGRAALVLLMLFKLYPQPLNEAQISYELQLDVRSIRKDLEWLASHELTLLAKGQGYVLTGDARRALAHLFGSATVVQFEAPVLALATQAQALQAPETDEQPIPEQETPAYAQDLPRANCASLLEEEDIQTQPINNDSSSIRSAQNARTVEVQPGQPTTLQILEATSLLFKDSMANLEALQDRSRRAAIGWVAQAYDQRRGLSSPQGLIYRRLLDRKLPQQKYLDHPRQFLPDNYLEALGLAEYPCPECGDKFAQRAQLDSHIAETHPITVEAEPQEEIIMTYATEKTPSETPDAEAAWQAVVNQLEGEMGRSIFETYIRPARAVSLTDGALLIACENDYAVDWMASRLAATIARKLVGILNMAHTSVAFTVAQDGAG